MDLTRFLDRSGETIREDDERRRGLAVRQRLEHHVVPALRERRAVPRPVKRDERAAAVGGRELLSVVDGEVVGRPMAGEHRDRRSLVGARPDRVPAVAAVLRGEDELLLGQAVVAVRPAIVGTALELHQLLGRLVGTLLRRVELRPVLLELVATVLGRKDPACGVDRDTFPIAKPRHEALGGREPLPRPVGVVAPDAAAGLELRAWLDAGRVEHPVLDLAGVGGRAKVDVQRTLRIDLEWMHGMVAGERQPGHDDLRRRPRRDRPRGQGVRTMRSFVSAKSAPL